MNKKDLPDIILDIHLGFAHGRNYIGKVDVDHCNELEIKFTGGSEMTIKATFPDNIKVEKHYHRDFGVNSIWRNVENESKPAATETADKD